METRIIKSIYKKGKKTGLTGITLTLTPVQNDYKLLKNLSPLTDKEINSFREGYCLGLMDFINQEEI